MMVLEFAWYDSDEVREKVEADTDQFLVLYSAAGLATALELQRRLWDSVLVFVTRDIKRKRKDER